MLEKNGYEKGQFMSQFENVTVVKKANVYFEGKCVSHSVVLSDGSKKSVGVIFPSTLNFNTAAPEVMEIIAGTCKVKLAGETEGRMYSTGQSFFVSGNSFFEIEVTDTVHYVCSFE